MYIPCTRHHTPYHILYTYIYIFTPYWDSAGSSVYVVSLKGPGIEVARDGLGQTHKEPSFQKPWLAESSRAAAIHVGFLQRESIGFL